MTYYTLMNKDGELLMEHYYVRFTNKAWLVERYRNFEEISAYKEQVDNVLGDPNATKIVKVTESIEVI